MQAIDESREGDFGRSIKNLLKNGNYILLLITYGKLEENIFKRIF